MPHRPQRQHALASFLNGKNVSEPDHSGVQLEVRPDYGYLNLRGNPGDEQFLQAVQATLGQPLPTTTFANTFTAGEKVNATPNVTGWLGGSR